MTTTEIQQAPDGADFEAPAHPGAGDSAHNTEQTSTRARSLGDIYDQLKKTAKIMIVDDEDIIIRAVTKYLKSSGFQQFVSTTDSRQAIELLRQERPNLVVLDVVMPNLSGFQVLEQIRTDQELQHTPVIILTDAADAENKMRALDLGATDFLAKPLQPKELSIRIRNVLAFGTRPGALSPTDSANGAQGTGPEGQQENVLTSDSEPKQEKTSSATIMIVDDEPLNIKVVRKYLQGIGYEKFIAIDDSRQAMELMHQSSPDVVLLDIMMPHVSGLDILEAKQTEESLKHIPVIVLTASNDPETKLKALDLGAYDFLGKPVDFNDLVPRVRNALVAKEYHDRLANHATELENQVQKRTAELAASRQEVIHCLARAAEYRDDDTGNHVARVGRYAGIIAREFGFHDARAEMLELAAQLHDVGKIGVPDAILNHPGKLDSGAYEIMKKHCASGKRIIEPIPEDELDKLQAHSRLGSCLLHVTSSPLLMLASTIAQTHHEKWDGSGYPLGLKGEDIPIEGRIVAVADVFDALSSERPYKPPFPREKCFAILEESRGSHFDPKVLDAFFRRSDEIIKVQIQYMDLD